MSHNLSQLFLAYGAASISTCSQFHYMLVQSIFEKLRTSFVTLDAVVAEFLVWVEDHFLIHLLNSSFQNFGEVSGEQFLTRLSEGIL